MSLTIPAMTLLLSLFNLASAQHPPYAKTQLSNQSSVTWKLTLVEGRQPQAGTLRCLDKFTGKLVKALAKSGETVLLAPGCKYLIDFAQGTKYCHHDFILEDPQGNYAEFIATVPYLANPQITLQLQGGHVGSPLNQSADEELTRIFEAAVRTENGSLTIVQNTIGQL